MGERLLGDLRDWYEMDGSNLRHLVADQLAPPAANYDLAAVTAAYRVLLNDVLDEHGLALDEHDRLVIDEEWINGDEPARPDPREVRQDGPGGRHRPPPAPRLTTPRGSAATMQSTTAKNLPRMTSAGRQIGRADVKADGPSVRAERSYRR